MKKIYSVLATLALLFSLPAIAAPLAEKAENSKAHEKEAHEKVVKEKVTAELAPAHEVQCPSCKGMGGC